MCIHIKQGKMYLVWRHDSVNIVSWTSISCIKCWAELHLKQNIILLLILFLKQVQSYAKCFADYI